MLTSGFLSVSNIHTIYYEVHGVMNGRPAIVLHGGPGGGIVKGMEKIYDLKKWCVILFDQRGCGRSTPFGELKENTTWYLIEDIEKLRQLFGWDKWFVSGGSWGTTLALAYAEKYPMRVTGLLLRGLCLSDAASFKWLYEKGGASEIYPDAWQGFIKVLPKKLHEASWKKIMRYFYDALNHDALNHDALNHDINAIRYANAWWGWEAAVSHLYPHPNNSSKKQTLSLAIIENYYFLHEAWLRPNQLLRNIKKLKSIPITIVHGRYDMVCPITQAFELKRLLPHIKLIVIPDAGHAGNEPGTWNALCKAVRSM
jgi:proline iminopeptidase